MADPASPPFEIRPSPLAGLGAFATRPIPAGTRLIEYVGERISHEEADSRYEDEDESESTHVLLFAVDNRTVIDAGVGGNDARFFNHSCEPNCDAVIERGRVFIDAARDIRPGEELTYDYELTRESDDPAEEARYPCYCGAPNCRGTLLEPVRKRRRSSARRPKRGGGAGRRAAPSAKADRRPTPRRRPGAGSVKRQRRSRAA